MAIRRGSGNPFADAGLEASPELLAKHQAVEALEREMAARGLSGADLARAAGLPASHISEILHRRLDRFSIDRLNRVLAVVGQRIEVEYRIVPTAA